MAIGNMNEVLTEDIVKVIFSKLPFSHLSNCRIVCKSWNHLVSDYALRSKFHHRKSVLVFTSEAVPNPGRGASRSCNPKVHSLDFGTEIKSVASFKFHGDWDSVSYYCSCNGLLYIARMSVSDWCDGVWNPMTNEFLPLPGLEGEEEKYFYGFGFSPKTKQYKLFRVFSDESLGTEIEIWRFGISNELRVWKRIGWRPLPQFFINDGPYLDGVIYWIANIITDWSRRRKRKKMKHVFVIHAFDVETETFETRYPSDIGPCSKTDFGIQLMSVSGKLQVIIGPCILSDFNIQLKSFNGQLGLIITMFQPIWKMCVWIMRKCLWIREFVIDIPIHERFKSSFIEASQDEISVLIKNEFYIFDKNGKIKKKISLNTNEIENVARIESFQFGSLSKILKEKSRRLLGLNPSNLVPYRRF